MGEMDMWVIAHIAARVRIRDVLWRRGRRRYGESGMLLLLDDLSLLCKPRGGLEGPRPLRLQSAGPALPVRGEFLRRAACRPRAKIHSAQFEVDLPLANRSRLWRDALVQIKDLKQRALRPKNAAAFLEKTANLSHNHQNSHVCPKTALTAITPKKPNEMNLRFISFEAKLKASPFLSTPSRSARARQLWDARRRSASGRRGLFRRRRPARPAAGRRCRRGSDRRRRPLRS